MIQIINPNKLNNLKKKKRTNAGGRLGQAQYGTRPQAIKLHHDTELVYILKMFITIMIIIIIIIPCWLLSLKVSLQLARFSVGSLLSTDISIWKFTFNLNNKLFASRLCTVPEENQRSK